MNKAQRDVTHRIAPGDKVAFFGGGKMRLEYVGKRKTLLSDGEEETYIALVVLPKKSGRRKTAVYERWARNVASMMDDNELDQFHALLDGDSRDMFFHFIGRELRNRKKPG